MKKNKIMMGMFAIILLFLSTPLYAGGNQNLGYEPDELIITTKSPVLWNQLTHSWEDPNMSAFVNQLPIGTKITRCADIPVLRQTPELWHQGKYYGTVFLIKLPTNIALPVLNYFDGRLDTNLVKELELNLIGNSLSSPPVSLSDPLFATSQGHLKYDIGTIQAGVKYTGVHHAYGYKYKNTNKLIVAVIDCGMNFLHQDLQGVWHVNNNEILNGLDDDGDGLSDNIDGWNFVGNNNDPTDDNTTTSHGTQVTGNMAVSNNNSLNMASIITDAGSILVLKAANSSGNITTFNATAAYNYALSKGARIINMSFIFSSMPSTLMTAIATGVSTYNAIPVAGSGNTGTLYYGYPASGPNVLTVGAANSGGVLWNNSSYSDSLDVLARGVNNLSLTSLNNTGTFIQSGTSVATPIISGYCWRILKSDPSLTVHQVIQIIRSMGINGTWMPQEGFGYVVGIDTFHYEDMRPDTLVYFNANTGLQPLPYTKHYTIEDSARFGQPSIVGHSVQTNGLAPGTYTYKMAWESLAYGQIYRDTFNLKFVINCQTTVTPSVSITSSVGSTACQSASVTFTATPVNGGTTPVYQWKVNGSNVGTNSPTYITTTLNNNDVVTVELTSNDPCVGTPTATSNGITMTINSSVTPSVTITPNQTTVCAGTNVTFTATPVNGGTPSYQWKKNSSNVGTNTPTYSDNTLISSDVITVEMSSTAQCAIPQTVTSNSSSITVNPMLTPSATIASSIGTTGCIGTSATYTATGTNVGNNPSYAWFVNSNPVGTNSATYSYSPVNGDVISCVITVTSGGCFTANTATSNTITMTMTSTVTPTVTITADQTGPICAGTNVTFTANQTGGGTPTYQWKKNGANVGTNSSAYTDNTLTSSDAVTVEMTSSLACAIPQMVTSNAISITVNAMQTPPQVTISHGSPYLDMNNDWNIISTSNVPSDWYTIVNQVLVPGPTNTTSYPHLMNFPVDTVIAIHTPIGCYSPVNVQDTDLVENPLDVAAFKLDPKSVTIYPNPTNEKYFFMNGLQDLKGGVISVRTIVGQTIHSHTIQGQLEERVELGDVAAGVYTIFVVDKDGRHCGTGWKFIKRE